MTLEDHQRAGGFGSAVLEAVSRQPLLARDARPARVRVFGIPDRFIEHMTTREEQLATAGLDADSVKRALLQALQTTRVG